MRMTLATRRVLHTLIGGDEKYGLQIAKEAGLSTGTVHPILRRWYDQGLMWQRREETDPRKAGRPARVYWSLTPAGAKLARERGVGDGS